MTKTLTKRFGNLEIHNNGLSSSLLNQEHIRNKSLQAAKFVLFYSNLNGMTKKIHYSLINKSSLPMLYPNNFDDS